MAKATNQPSSRYAVCAHASFHLECLLCCHVSGSQEASLSPPWCDMNELTVCVP